MKKLRYLLFVLGAVFLMIPQVNALSTKEVKEIVETSDTYEQASFMGYTTDVLIQKNQITISSNFDYNDDGLYESCDSTFTLKNNILTYRAQLSSKTQPYCVAQNDPYFYEIIRSVLQKSGYGEEGITNLMERSLEQLSYNRNGIKIVKDQYVFDAITEDRINYVEADYIKSLKMYTKKISIEGFSILDFLAIYYLPIILATAAVIVLLISRYIFQKLRQG